MLYGKGLPNTIIANESMTLETLEKVMVECDNNEYYHKFVVNIFVY